MVLIMNNRLCNETLRNNTYHLLKSVKLYYRNGFLCTYLQICFGSRWTLMLREDFLSMSLEQSPIIYGNILIKKFNIQQRFQLYYFISCSKDRSILITVLHSNSSDISGQSWTRSHLSVIGMQVPSLHVKSFS